MPKLETVHWLEQEGGPNQIFKRDNGPYSEIRLGDAAGLTQFGVRLERLPPGSRSSHRHWHETEDEFVYLISGELVLVESDEVLLQQGEAAGWKAGRPTAHCLENRSTSEAVMLVVGTRSESGVVHYPDHDLTLHHDRNGNKFTRSDGSPVDLLPDD